MVRKLLIALIFTLLTAGLAQASVDVYISDLNIYASKEFGKFKAELSANFGISGSRFDLMLKKVDSPGDLAVALWLGNKSLQSIDDVVKQYRIHRGKGWGVVAKGLGIKPGSPLFQDLKKGTIGWLPKNFEEVVKGKKPDKPQERKKKKRKSKGY